VELDDIPLAIRTSAPEDLLDLADRLEDLARQHEIAHESNVDRGDEDVDERIRLLSSQLRIIADSATEDTRTHLGRFAHLEETSDDGEASIYKTEPIDVWTAPYAHVDELVDDYARTVGELPESVETRLRRIWERGHAFRLRTHPDGYTVLEAETEDLFEDVAKEHLEHNTHYTQYVDDTTMRLKKGAEADVKEALYDAGYPPLDERDLERGDGLDVDLVDDITPRPYQKDWVERFMDMGSGVIDAPPGAGKTVAALAILAEIGAHTLILVPSRELAQQWQDELEEKTTLGDSWRSKIGQYHGGEKNIAPVTITTYDMASKSRHGRKLFDREWGLVIFDESHHVPAEVWRRTADIQSRHRLGLTATPVREDGKSEEIFTLIGRPVTSGWEELYSEGWVSRPNVEVRLVPWGSDEDRQRYRNAEGIKTMIAAASNEAKLDETRRILDEHAGDKILLYCGWTDVGERYSEALDVPFIHGETRHSERDRLYEELRTGERDALMVSRVADEGIDLPDIDVVVMVTMLGGSRRQGTQRVGRVMRPFGEADAYLLATRGSREEEYAREQMDHLREKGTVVEEVEVDG
jgi:DNA excision repair protein ERCC-3